MIARGWRAGLYWKAKPRANSVQCWRHWQSFIPFMQPYSSSTPTQTTHCRVNNTRKTADTLLVLPLKDKSIKRNQRSSMYLHDFQKWICDDFKRLEWDSLLFGRSVSKRPVARTIAGPKGADRGRLHFAYAKQLVELRKRELGQTELQHSQNILWKWQRPSHFQLMANNDSK